MNKYSMNVFRKWVKWATDEGYTFLAKDLADAIKYIEMTGQHLGTLKEAVSE